MALCYWLGQGEAEVAARSWPGLGWGSGSSCGLSRARLNRSEPLGGDPTDRNGGEGLTVVSPEKEDAGDEGDAGVGGVVVPERPRRR